ncbi:MAG: efflux RND transporter periplasmic adaptor subunit [bacterium]|nr:efflux RND transporter periplasmic adaptor subunit [bacterium]
MNKYSIGIVIIAITIGGLWFGMRDTDTDTGIITATVSRADIVRDVSVTGTIVAAQRADLGFNTSGTVSSILYESGDTVQAGFVISRLHNASLVVSRSEAEASREAAKAKLLKLQQGPTVEDKELADANLENARVTLAEKTSLHSRELRDAFTETEIAIFNKADQAFSNPRVFPQLLIVGANSQLRSDVELGRRQIETILNAWRAISRESSEDILVHQNEIETWLAFTAGFLGDVSGSLSGVTTGGAVSDATLEGWQTDVASARSTVDALRRSVELSKDEIVKARSAVTIQERTRDVVYVETSPVDLAVQVALVAKEDASIDRINAQIEDTLIRAPFTGTIGKIDVRTGEQVNANTPVVTMQSTGVFQIEAYIPEIDIELVRPGQTARVTLDAFGAREELPAEVVFVERAATVQGGVATYKTVLQFKATDARIRSGMSANVDIGVAEVSGVLGIPGRAVQSRDGLDSVRILKPDGSAEEVIVELGLRGTFGDVEIVSGLTEGDIIIVRMP